MKKTTKTSAKAMDLVLKCGIPPSLSGCKYFAEATELYANSDYSITDIYRILSEKNGVKPKSIMRDMSYAISQGYDTYKHLSEIAGVEIPYGQLHNSLVVSYLAIELNRDHNKQS